MFLSTFDLFKIGVGPSSSHTMGPMTAAARFLAALRDGAAADERGGAPARLQVSLHGSLAFTGRGHATDRAVILGLTGLTPETMDPDAADTIEAEVRRTGRVAPPGLPPLAFHPDRDLVFDYGPPLPGHANGMILRALDGDGRLRLEQTFYSIGGGFVVTPEELHAAQAGDAPPAPDCPFPFRSAAEMLAMGETSGLGIAAMKRANEIAIGGPGLDERLARLHGRNLLTLGPEGFRGYPATRWLQEAFGISGHLIRTLVVDALRAHQPDAAWAAQTLLGHATRTMQDAYQTDFRRTAAVRAYHEAMGLR